MGAKRPSARQPVSLTQFPPKGASQSSNLGAWPRYLESYLEEVSGR